MRPIRFKVWDVEKKKWLVEFRLTSDGGILTQEQIPEEPYKLEWVSYDTKRYILQQFTGVYDIKNKPIYEGDIIKGKCSDKPQHVCQGLKLSNLMGKEVVGFIDYSSTYAQFRFTTDEITYLAFPFGILSSEVIGNMCQDKSLLINRKRNII